MIIELQNKKRLFSLFLLIIIIMCSALFVFSQEEVDDDDAEFTQGEETQNVISNEDPTKLFYKAQDAHSKGDLENALKLYEQALKANPEFPEAEFQRGTIFESLGKTLEAEKAFRKAIELRRDWTLPIAELGALLVNKGEYVEAATQLKKAIRINNMSFPAYIALTELKIRTNANAQDLKLHLGKLQYLTTKSKIPAAVWAARAAIERKLGNKTSAKSSIARALSIDNKDAYALQESIEISLLDGDTKGAIKNARNLGALFPHSTNAKLLLARSLYRDGNTKEAVKVLDSVKNPRNDVLQLKSAYVLNSNDNIESLEALLKENDKNITILGRLCTLSRVIQPIKALKYCQTASQLAPKEINHAIGYGAALVQLKRYTSAINLFRKLVTISPKNYTIRANLATALFQANRFEEAKKEYLWITEKQPEIAVGYYFLAISHDRLDEYLDAMANYQQFLRIADNSLKLEIEKVNLRLPSLQNQIKKRRGKKRR